MLEIFRKNLFINNVLLLPYTIMVRMATFIFPQQYQVRENANEVVKAFFSIVDTSILQSVVSVILIFIHASMINQLFTKHKLAQNNTLLPGLFYVVFTSVLMDFMVLSPVLIANTFVIIAIMNILKTYKITNATAYIFNTGFFIGVASIFYLPYIFLVMFGVIILWIFRSFKHIEKLQYFSGFFVPYIFVLVYRYLNDFQLEDKSILQNLFFRIPHFGSDVLIVKYICVGILLFLVLVSLFSYSTIIGKKIIQIRKKVEAFYWILLYSLVSFLIFSTDGSFHLLTLAIPLSLLIGMLVSDSKARISFELIHFLILGLIFLTQFKLILL